MLYIHIFLHSILVVQKFATLPLWHSQGHPQGRRFHPSTRSRVWAPALSSSTVVGCLPINRMNPPTKTRLPLTCISSGQWASLAGSPSFVEPKNVLSHFQQKMTTLTSFLANPPALQVWSKTWGIWLWKGIESNLYLKKTAPKKIEKQIDLPQFQ